MQNVFTEEISMIALSSNDNKRMQSFDSIETYTYGTSKDLVSENKDIKCNNIIRLYKRWLTLMMLEKKTQTNIIQICQKLMIINTAC